MLKIQELMSQVEFCSFSIKPIQKLYISPSFYGLIIGLGIDAESKKLWKRGCCVYIYIYIHEMDKSLEVIAKVSLLSPKLPPVYK